MNIIRFIQKIQTDLKNIQITETLSLKPETLKLKPDLTVLRYDYANLLADMNRNDLAISEYKKYLAVFPDNAQAYCNLALVYKRGGNVDLAIINFAKCISKDEK